MSSNNYQIYINQILQLAETMVIKSSFTAQALNEWVISEQFRLTGTLNPIDSDPHTWKYYLNLSGQYHNVDQPMVVVSMDTLEEIIFNKENLVIHRATARAYQYGTNQYDRLVARYPDQEQLILGILYPVDIDTAIAAEDGQILSYPAYLVEENEYTLIPRLQTWINHYKDRWYIPGFAYTDDLYCATMLGQMHLLLVPAILTERLVACNTNEAHSFHIRQYLGSHGYLDSYVDSLTTKQALYFYRNIRYIERHAGRNSTLDQLTEHIMTARSIPLAEYTMKHDVAQQADNLYPEVIFQKRQLNLGIELPANNQISLPLMLAKEAPLAPNNNQDLEDTAQQIKELMENSPSNVVATKALESSMVDDTNSSPWVLSEILFNHWLYFSSVGLYTAYVSINNPQTGEKMPLTAKESFILAMYALSKSLGFEPTVIPPTYASRVQRIPMTTVDDIYSIVDSTLIDRSDAVTALSVQPNISTMVSIDAFYATCVNIDAAVQIQRRLIAKQEHYEARGMMHAMVTRIYSDYVLELEPSGTLYDTWMSQRNIDLTKFSRTDFELLYNDIVSQATGASLHPNQSLKELQKAMVNMFAQLSSYGIQIITEINDSSIRKTDWPGTRLGTVTGTMTFHPQNPDTAIGAENIGQEMAYRVEMDLDHPGVDPNVTQHSHHRVELDPTVKETLACHPVTYVASPAIHSMKVQTPDPEVEIPRGWVPFLGIELFLQLTQSQLRGLVDIYNGELQYISPLKVPLQSVVSQPELLPFQWDDGLVSLDTVITNPNIGPTYLP